MSQYVDAPLPYPINDGMALKTLLQAHGVDVLTAYDCMIDELKEVRDQYLDSLQPGDIALISFCGHGCVFNNEQRLLALKTFEHRDLRHDSLGVLKLIAKLTKRRVGMIIMILDCCREFKYGGAVRATRTDGYSYQPPAGVIIAHACGSNKFAFEHHGEPHGRPTTLVSQSLRVHAVGTICWS